MAHLSEADFLQQASSRLLEEALERVLQQLDGSGEVRKFIESYSGWFSNYYPGCEHVLEWSDMHNDYCLLAEEFIRQELQVSGCSESALIYYAENGSSDPEAERLLSRLLSMTDYERFCEMMQRASRMPLSVEEEDDDDGEAYAEVVEVDEDEDEEDEGLEQCERAVTASRLDRISQLQEQLEDLALQSHG